MSWVTALSTLYDQNASHAGVEENWHGKPLVLLPVGFTTVKARIEIRLDAEGNYLGARALSKQDDVDTLAPATEKSMSRTSSTIAPHPLFDSLKYVAGDFLVWVQFDSQKKGEITEKKKNDIANCFSTYEQNLNAWCESEDYSNPKVCAVYNYISKKTLLSDLMRENGLLIVKDGRVLAEQKLGGEVLEKAAVRFCVMPSQSVDANTLLQSSAINADSRIWLDTVVQKSFMDYYASIEHNDDLCYFTGNRTRITALLPKKIRYDGDGAKLISSNDKDNFTYRGRFLTKDESSGYNEALSIGYDTAQKIHNALKWIIRRQGYTKGGLCIVAWESDLREIPPYYSGAREIIDLSTSEDSQAEDESLLDEPENKTVETNYVSAKKLNQAIDGYAKDVKDTSQMVVLALNNASPGRLAMIYFKELSTSMYLANIRAWQESCCWRHAYFQDNKYYEYAGMASLHEIAKAVYGTEQEANGVKALTLRANSDKKCPMLISTFERLRPCILDGAFIPQDMVKAAVQKAANPLAYESQGNYQRVLHIACSMVKKYYWDKGVKYDMKLDEACDNRSYLYGRLLAVAEKIERSTYDKDETRTTNAERYMQQFSRTPLRTWALIRTHTQVYLNQLKPGSREFYKNLYGEIDGLFSGDDYAQEGALDGRFLLGYDCQREALKLRKNDSVTPTADNEITTNTNKEAT